MQAAAKRLRRQSMMMGIGCSDDHGGGAERPQLVGAGDSPNAELAGNVLAGGGRWIGDRQELELVAQEQKIGDVLDLGDQPAAGNHDFKLGHAYPSCARCL